MVLPGDIDVDPYRVSHVLLNVRQTSDIMYQIIMTGYAESAYPTDHEYDR